MHVCKISSEKEPFETDGVTFNDPKEPRNNPMNIIP